MFAAGCSDITLKYSRVKKGLKRPKYLSIKSSRLACADSNWYPICSSSFSFSAKAIAFGLSRVIEVSISLSFAAIALRPDISDSRIFLWLPTVSGDICSNETLVLYIPSTCMPPLWDAALVGKCAFSNKWHGAVKVYIGCFRYHLCRFCKL